MRRAALSIAALAATAAGAVLIHRRNARARDAELWSRAADPIA